jgi:predicted dehydrogenase
MPTKTGRSAHRNPASAPVAVALAGCGAVAQRYYAPALQTLEKAGWVQVHALFDPNGAMRQLLKQFFPSALEVEEFSELGRQIDLVIVASPPSVHAEQSVELLRSGIAVLCEKPLATSVAEAQAMIDAAAESSSILAAGMVRRFFPATQMIREMLASNAIGDVTSFVFEEGDVFRWPVASAAYFEKRVSGGGVLTDIGAHALDLMVWWFGEPLEIRYEDDAMGGVEANCRVRCRFASGISGEVRLSRDCALSNRYVVRGTRGWLSWWSKETNRLEASFGEARYTLNAGLEEAGKPAAHFERSFIEQICNVISAMTRENTLHVSAADVLPSLRVIERCYALRLPMSMPWLDPAQASRAAELNRLS